MSVLSDVVASLRESGATAELVRDDDDSAFAWAELGDLAASIDYVFDDKTGSWVASVAASPRTLLSPCPLPGAPVSRWRPSASELHDIVLDLLQTETTTP
jgi:hypothetical protein